MMQKHELSENELHLLGLMEEREGFYEVTKDSSSKRLTPLVGYAADYEVIPGGGRLHFVGERYWNVPKAAEADPTVMAEFANPVVRIMQSSDFIGEYGKIDCMFGCPLGGNIPAFEMARLYGCAYSGAEKKTIGLATEGSREKTKLILGRHSIRPGWHYALTEELINNLSTTDKAIQLIEDAGGIVVVIAALINRSPDGVIVYEYKDRRIPIIQSVLIPTSEYRQDDQYVADDVANGNVVWKPKDNWSQLKAA